MSGRLYVELRRNLRFLFVANVILGDYIEFYPTRCLAHSFLLAAMRLRLSLSAQY